MMTDGYETYCVSLITAAASGSDTTTTTDAVCGCLQYLGESQEVPIASGDLAALSDYCDIDRQQ